MGLWRELILLLLAAAVGYGSIIFPGELDHAEGDTCPTNTNEMGVCSKSCDRSLNFGDPRRCGIKDSKFLVCCEQPTVGAGPQSLTDISPPRVLLQCGINTKDRFFLFGGEGGGVLRPEAVPDPTLPKFEATTSVRPDTATVHLTNLETALSDLQTPPAGAAIGAMKAEVNAWPWMALIGERDAQGNRWFCGGVLINDRFVLTALHCFFNNKADVVRLGEHNYNNDYDGAAHEDFAVAGTLHYPGYNHPEAYHDLAILRLASRVNLKKHIQPVCLPWGKESDKDLIGQNATLTGWGDTAFGGLPSSILQEVNVTVFPSARCDSSYSNLPHYPSTWPRGIRQETLCAGAPDGGRDACQGDSGGPLVSQDARGHFVLAGIVSRGYGCGHKDYPGLYVNLRHPPHLSWIKKIAFATI